MSKYIRFDWAMKRLLRNKANHVVLEGFLSVLLEQDIKIHKFLESEGNQESANDKYNRVDIMCEDKDGRKMIIEVQNEREYGYFHRMLYVASKAITEYMELGDGYEKVQKVYSISIVYFDLGQGTDYVYRGRTDFHGLHGGELLKLSPKQQEMFGGKLEPGDLMPEYYLQKAVEALAREKTVIMISHRLSNVTAARRIYYMEDGLVWESGTHDQLLKQNGRYASLWDIGRKNVQWTIGNGEVAE